MPKADAPPAYQHYPRDIQSDRSYQSLDSSERGHYRDGMDHSWLDGGYGIGTEDEWRVWMGYSTRDWQRHRDNLSRCFYVTPPVLSRDGGVSECFWVQKRLVRTRMDQVARRKIQSDKGVSGARARWSTNGTGIAQASPGIARPMPVDSSSSASASASARETESQSQHLSSAARTARAPSAPRASRSETPLFVQFYERTWPRRVKRDKAWLAWQSAVSKGAEPLLLIRAAEKWRDAYANVGTPEDKILHPASWLNGGCWKDDPSVPRPDGYAGRMDTDAASKLADEAVRKFLEE